MTVKLLNEHHLEFISLQRGYTQAYLNLHLSKCHIVGNRMSRLIFTGPRSAVGNVSDYRCVSDCNSRGREFVPGPVPYFRGD